MNMDTQNVTKSNRKLNIAALMLLSVFALCMAGIGILAAVQPDGRADPGELVQPASQPEERRIVQIGLGQMLDEDGYHWAWGSPNSSNLATGGGAENSGVPIRNNFMRFSQITVPAITFPATTGSNFMIGLDSNGYAYGWGAVTSMGQAGVGENPPSSIARPTRVNSNVRFAQVSTGVEFTLALCVDGYIWSWGRGIDGRLGTGDTLGRFSPTRIDSDLKFVYISAGTNHSLAIDEDGYVWAWGLGSFGRLGTGNTTTQNSPVRINSNVRFTQVSAGTEHSLAIDEDGYAWAWGLGNEGRLGTGGSTITQNSPVRVVSNVRFTQVSAGARHSLAIDENGLAWAWGWGMHGALGTGNATSQGAPVRVNSNLQFVQINASRTFENSTAIDYDGNPWVWGDSATADHRTGSAGSEFSPIRLVATFPGMLGAPDTLQIENQVLSWRRSEHAIGYHVYINGTRRTTGANGLAATVSTWTIPALGEATFDVQVRAMGTRAGWQTGNLSAPIQFNSELVPLTAPASPVVSATPRLFTWADTGTTTVAGWHVYLNGERVTHTMLPRTGTGANLREFSFIDFLNTSLTGSPTPEQITHVLTRNHADFDLVMQYLQDGINQVQVRAMPILNPHIHSPSPLSASVTFDSELAPLNAPFNLNMISGHTLQWTESVQNAGWHIYLNGERITHTMLPRVHGGTAEVQFHFIDFINAAITGQGTPTGSEIANARTREHANGDLIMSLLQPLGNQVQVRAMPLTTPPQHHSESPLSVAATLTLPAATPLSAPTGLAINNGTITWDAVTNAHGFRIYVDGQQHEVTANNRTFDLNALGLGFGTHSVEVRTLSSPTQIMVSDSTTTASINFTVPRQLVAPVLSLGGNILSWTLDSDATGVNVYLYTGGTLATTVPLGAVTWFNLSGVLNVGTHEVRVRAIGNDVDFVNSELSNMQTVVMTDPAPVPAPTNLDVTGNVLSWQWNGTGANTGFEIIFEDSADDVIHTATSGSSARTYNFGHLNLAYGVYTIQVRALGDGIIGGQDQPSVLVLTEHIVSGYLATPTNVRIENGTLLWNAVTNADYFQVSIGGTTHTVRATSLDIAGLGLSVGSHTMQVRALSDTPNLFSPSGWATLATDHVVMGQLNAPVLSFNKSTRTLSWTRPTNSVAGFYLYINGVDQYVSGTTHYIGGFAPNTYEFRVRAQGSGYWNDSVQSNMITHTIVAPNEWVLTTVINGISTAHNLLTHDGHYNFNLYDITPTAAYGYEFMGWALEDNGSVVFRSNATLAVHEDMTLHAIFSRIGLPRLETPTSVQIIDGMLVWDSVQGASGYRIYLRGDFAASWAIILIEDGFINMIDISFFGPGLYVIQVVALSPDQTVTLDSYRSAEIQHSVDGATTPPDNDPNEPIAPPDATNRLARPINVTHDYNGIIRWEAVANAYNYALYLNGVRMAYTINTWFDASNWNIVIGSTNIVSIRALAADDSTYNDSQLSLGTIFTHIEPSDPLLPDDPTDFTWLFILLGSFAGMSLLLALLVLLLKRRQAPAH